MSFFTNILQWVSNGLLIPIILLLLVSLILSLIMIGSFYSSFLLRQKFLKSVNNLFIKSEKKDISTLNYKEIKLDDALFKQSLEKMQSYNWDENYCQKVIADFESNIETSVNKSRLLLRVGPMLGLMGTLIPMGPALVGLAAGDIASMALNMQVAFSTTVVGIFIGAVGYIVNLKKSSWGNDDCNNLTFLFNIISTRIKNDKK